MLWCQFYAFFMTSALFNHFLWIFMILCRVGALVIRLKQKYEFWLFNMFPTTRDLLKLNRTFNLAETERKIKKITYVLTTTWKRYFNVRDLAAQRKEMGNHPGTHAQYMKNKPNRRRRSQRRSFVRCLFNHDEPYKKKFSINEID